MSQKRVVYIWKGERVLLPDMERERIYSLRCISGSGLIRLMSRSRPVRLEPQQELMIPADEVVTVSGSEDMVILLQPGKVTE